MRRALVLLTAALFAASALIGLPIEASSILLAPAIAVLPMLLVLPARGLIIVAPAHVFPAPHLFGAAALSFYSFWNLHDVSWGTKGLTHSSPSAFNCAARLRLWRKYAFSGWVLSNAAMIAIALNCQGVLTEALNPVVETFCIVDTLIATVALCFLLFESARRRLARIKRLRTKRESLDAGEQL